MSRCPQRADLLDYVDDLLPVAGRLELAKHLDLCGDCHTAVRELVTPSETEAPTRLADPLV
ncbi:MAG: hypothetical protein JNK82_02840, partial [Myxococcaceae bacterium]|nr:hypothetical protein [Myxococcaceae bacterium]